jgi:2-amino-4-hydroxy-6-hydroxymethyldihydropteridine diphosphokinase
MGYAMKKMVYLSLGSNLGERQSNLRAALDRLRPLGQVIAVSSVYETEPVQFKAQPWFLNCVVALETELMPKLLLKHTQHIEQQMGRRRYSGPSPKKGPRAIDIDILLFGKVVIDTPELVVPHLAMHERRFVLEPLAEIAPEVRHPVFHATIRQLRDAAVKERRQALRKLGDLLTTEPVGNL